ncbi:MAG TPA: polysaccharide deacetylase family protein [Ktedonobacterales bacterium]
MPSFDERDTPARVATADPPPAPRRAASRGRPPRPPWRTVALAALAVGMVSVLVLIGLFAAPGGARFIVERLGQSITTPLPTATIPPAGTPAPGPPTPSPQGTVAPGTLASPQGCGPRGARPQPPSHIISSAAGYSGAHGEVALTFDDGPAPIFTRQILDELRAAGAHATFFVVGEHAQRYPDLVRAELAGGNAVGNHTFTHQDLAGKSVDDVRWQLTTTTSTLRAITRDPCLWLFRAPYGLFDASMFDEARREGLTTVLWDVWALDWTRPGTQVIAQRIIAHLHSGAIILLHDAGSATFTPDRSQTADALPAILRAIHARGLRAVTLPMLLMDAGLVRVPGAHGESPPVTNSSPDPTLPPGTEGALAPPVGVGPRYPFA